MAFGATRLRRQGCLGTCAALRVTCHEQDPRLRPQLRNAFAPRRSAQFRHHDIGQQKMNRSVKRLRDLQRLYSIAGRQNFVSTIGKKIGRQIQQRFFILHQENGAGPRAAFGVNCFWAEMTGRFQGLRQENLEALRPFPARNQFRQPRRSASRLHKPSPVPTLCPFRAPWS